MNSASLKLTVLTLFLCIVTCSFLFSQDVIPASPYGGKQQLREFIDEEMVYPAAELEHGTEGTVVIGCMVGRDAAVSDVKILKGVSPEIDKEALRIFSLLLWKPAISLGAPCDGKAEVEIDFSVKRYRKAVKNRGYDKPVFPHPKVDSSGKIYSYRNTDSPPTPVFPGKSTTMQQFMADNFRYPEPALRQNITGVVILNFVVEPHGRISNVMVGKHLGAGCSEEALRLVKMFTWNPGIVEGKAVRTMMSLSMSFSLSGGTGYNVQPAQPGISLQ